MSVLTTGLINKQQGNEGRLVCGKGALQVNISSLVTGFGGMTLLCGLVFCLSLGHGYRDTEYRDYNYGEKIAR